MNWFKYRLPGSSKSVSGGSERIINGMAEGFVIAPFINPDQGLITIPFDIPEPDFKFLPQESFIPKATSRKEYEEEVRSFILALGGQRGKTVAARVISININVDLDATFENLCSTYPEAFVFMFSTPITGTWIGASPELILSKDGDFLSTMALAGTRPSSEEDKGWDEKNRDEQAMVAEFIIDTLTKHCATVTAGKTFTKKAGPVEHICTPISAFMHHSPLADEFDDSDINRLRRLLSELSPTPAVCGTPRSRSLELIEKYEIFQREMYGGFCGPYYIDGATALFVNLRSAKVSEKQAAIFVGGGITPLSDPEAEWLETELKSKTIIDKLKTSEK